MTANASCWVWETAGRKELTILATEANKAEEDKDKDAPVCYGLEYPPHRLFLPG